MVVGLLWQLDWQAFCSCVRGGMHQGVLPAGLCYYLGNSSSGRVCLALNAVGLLRSNTNNKINVCGWCKFIPCITSLVIMSLSLEEGVDVEVASEEWEEKFLEKLLARLKETVKEKEVGVPQSGSSGSGLSSQSEGG